jgi:hypothetical protein
MKTVRLFLASSSELKEDRKEFEIFIYRKSKDWVPKGIFLELIIWEDFLDALSRTRLQDEYNKAVRECDIFVMLFFAKVGKYTEEEFDAAFQRFKATNKPFIFTYFKDAPVSPAALNLSDLSSLRDFQQKLKDLGHYQTNYNTIEDLQYQFNRQLDKLAAKGFIEFLPERETECYRAALTGAGAIAQGTNAKAVGAGGVLIGGNNTGNINTGGEAYAGGNVTVKNGDFIGRDKK